jgi:hypothetical protein
METVIADPIVVDATIEHVVQLDEPLAIAECSFKISKPNYARERGSTIAKPGCRVTPVTIHPNNIPSKEWRALPADGRTDDHHSMAGREEFHFARRHACDGSGLDI